jgi:DNA-binding beta-propeller fold protein YncE
MKRQLNLGSWGVGALAAGLVLIAGIRVGTGAEEGQVLERVAIIQWIGASGPLDHLLVDSKNSRLFVANQSNDTLDVVDLKGQKAVKKVAGQKKIHGIAYVSELDRIFVGNGEGVCNVLDGRDYSLLKSHPIADADNVHYDSRTNHVFVAGEKDLTVIDAKSLDLVTTIKLPGSPEGFQNATKQPRLYVNTGSPCEVAVIDTDKNEVIGHFPLKAEKGIETLVLDEANKRIFVGFRGEPRIVVLELESGKEVASVAIPEGIDDMFYDAKAKRIYASCGSGFVAVVRQVDADHYELAAKVATIKGAKTSYYDTQTARLYLAVPRQEGKEGPEIWVYQAKS